MKSRSTIEPVRNYIDGAWHVSESGRSLAVLNPATAEALAQVPLSSEAEVKGAIEAVAAAFPEWRRVPAAEPSPITFEWTALPRLGTPRATRNGQLGLYLIVLLRK